MYIDFEFDCSARCPFLWDRVKLSFHSCLSEIFCYFFVASCLQSHYAISAMESFDLVQHVVSQLQLHLLHGDFNSVLTLPCCILACMSNSTSIVIFILCDFILDFNSSVRIWMMWNPWQKITLMGQHPVFVCGWNHWGFKLHKPPQIFM